jgi:hypothetical protein
LDVINIASQVETIREWFEGFEELQALPDSFAVMFKDGKRSISFTANSVRDKVVYFTVMRLLTLADIHIQDILMGILSLKV